jgi:transposase
MARNPAALPNPARIADEQAKCFDLKRMGMSVRAIAAELNMSSATVQRRLQDAYDELVMPVAAEVKKMELERLDSYLLRLEKRLQQGEDPIRVVPVAMKVLERRARYLGLDEPEKIDATVHEVSQQDLAIAELVREAQAQAANQESALRGRESTP